MDIKSRFFKKGIILFFLLIFISALLAFICADAADKPEETDINAQLPSDVSLYADVNPAEATIGDIITYTLRVVRLPDVTVKLSEIDINTPMLTLLEKGKSEPQKKGGKVVEKSWFRFRVNEVGTVEFPEVKTFYVAQNKRREIKSNLVTLKVKSLLKKDMKDISGIKPLEKPGFDIQFLYYIVAGILIILIVILIIFFIKKRNKMRKNKKIAPPPLPPDIEAENALKELEAMDLIKDENFKKHYYILSEIFRRYIERRFQIKAVEKTTEEIIKNLRTYNIENGKKQIIRDFLLNSDPIKFAGEMPSMEKAEKEIQNVREFISSTTVPEEIKSEEKPNVAA